MPNFVAEFALPRSFVFRLTLIYAGIVTLSIAVLLAFVYTVTLDTVSEQLDRDVGAELDSLTSEAAMDVPRDFSHEIDVRSAALNKSQFLYALRDRAGTLVAGSPLKALTSEGWATAEVEDRGADKHVLRLKAKRLPNGMMLVVGADTDRISAVRTFLLEAMPTGLVAALLLAFAGAAVMGVSFRRRMERITAVCGQIMAGRLTVRAPVGNAGDEVDLVARSMNAMLDRIGTLMEAMRQVTNDVAHDLRTPLSRLRQGLERARLKARTAQDYESAVDAAIAESDGLLDTFAALLRIAEMEAGTQRASFVSVDLSQVLTSVVEAYEADAEDGGHHLVAEIETGVVVTGDSNLLTQMAANLVENALRHCPAGTTVTLRLSKNESGRPVLVIADNGPGIPEADRTRVFGRFVRLERSRTTPGSGLGLSLVAAVADLHKIRVTLGDNHPGLRCDLAF